MTLLNITARPLLQKLESTRELPAIPVILVPLLRYMERPPESVDVHHIVKLIAQDKSLAARCLQMANSPLFACGHQVETIQSAVVALGLDRIQEIAVSCSLLRLLPAMPSGVNPAVFWAHSLGCALVARELTARLRLADPEKTYAAGLLHDIGILALIWVAPHDFRRALEYARATSIPLHEAEQKMLGLTHCESGSILAHNWGLPAELAEVIAHHHCAGRALLNPALTAMIAVSDLLCRLNGIGHGYAEPMQADFSQQPAFRILAAHCPALADFDLSRFTFETGAMLEEIHTVVSSVYRIGQ